MKYREGVLLTIWPLLTISSHEIACVSYDRGHVDRVGSITNTHWHPALLAINGVTGVWL
jgi:hypothetical protein